MLHSHENQATSSSHHHLPTIIEDIIGPERLCSCCQEYWPLDEEFWFVQASNIMGFATQCKACMSEKRSQPRKINAEADEATSSIDVEGLISEKACSTCKIIKPLTKQYFRTDSHTSTGFASQCKDCKSAREKKRVQELTAARAAAKST